jgi:hypothetical protein
MEIKQGYTLSQFVDKVAETTNAVNLLSGYSDEYQAIIIYNEFLKQPLKKEMFVNPIYKELSFNKVTGEYDIEWQEAEKKVIFKGEKIVHNYSSIEYKHSDNYSVFYYPEAEKEWDILIFGVGYLNELDTLGDLFQATNSELETQNIEL